MMDEKLLITLEKVGKKIKNANELSVDYINNLAKEVEEYKDYTENADIEFLYWEEVYDEMRSYGLKIRLNDDSVWEIETTWSTEQRCVKHNLFPSRFDSEEYIFACKDDNLFLCDECKTFGRKHPKILKKYSSCKNYMDEWIFPIEWTEQGIDAWCKKREIKQREYEERREANYEARREAYLFNKYCSSCCHMIHGECEYNNDSDEDFDYICDDYEEI